MSNGVRRRGYNADLPHSDNLVGGGAHRELRTHDRLANAAGRTTARRGSDRCPAARNAQPTTRARQPNRHPRRNGRRADIDNIVLEYPVPDWASWGVTMYDASLTRVVVASDVFETGQLSYALWDVPVQRALASVPAGRLLQPPRWPPDGSRFVVAANGQTADTWLTFEMYGAARQGGAVERLTHLTARYAKVYIQSYTWSPDGRLIAFWFVDNPEGVPFIEHGEAHLGVLDTVTVEVTNTCVPVEQDASLAAPLMPPPWSPAGRQIRVGNSAADGSSRVLLVDLASGVAAKIAEAVRPEGGRVAGS